MLNENNIINSYEYCNNNPLGLTDKYGEAYDENGRYYINVAAGEYNSDSYGINTLEPGSDAYKEALKAMKAHLDADFEEQSKENGSKVKENYEDGDKGLATENYSREFVEESSFGTILISYSLEKSAHLIKKANFLKLSRIFKLEGGIFEAISLDSNLKYIQESEKDPKKALYKMSYECTVSVAMVVTSLFAPEIPLSIALINHFIIKPICIEGK